MILNSDTFAVSTPSDREILVERKFNAPRHVVHRTMSEPALLKRWLFGPPGWTMTECEEDARVGGSFRWAWSGPNGEAMSMGGVYREVDPPARVVRTERFDFGCDAQMGEQVATMELFDDGAATRMKLTVLYPSKEARDAALASGMEHGMSAGYDRLEEMLAGGAA